MPEFDHPENDVIQISLFGGNAYGESILIHVYNDFWILVDSCINPSTKEPLTLEYLKKISPDFHKKIKIACATHWHDDHIKGLAEIIRKSQLCDSLFLSNALTAQEFIELTQCDENLRFENSGIKEFNRIMKILDERNLVFKKSIEDRVLFKSSEGEIPVEIVSLSPSDKSCQETLEFFAMQLKRQYEDSNFVIEKQHQNHNSVVLLINIDNTSLLLGADLEVTGDSQTGWEAVLNSQTCKSSTRNIVYKVPHHGSSNGYHLDIWNNLLYENVYAILTPWKLGRKYLPTNDDKERILNHTSNAFITSQIPPLKLKKRDKKVYKITNDLDIQIAELPFSYGHIRLRKKISDENWTVDLFEKAIDLSNLTVDED